MSSRREPSSPDGSRSSRAQYSSSNEKMDVDVHDSSNEASTLSRSTSAHRDNEDQPSRKMVINNRVIDLTRRDTSPERQDQNLPATPRNGKTGDRSMQSPPQSPRTNGKRRGRSVS